MVCNQLNELFRSEHGAVYQCSKNNCYWLEFNGETSSFKVSDFLRFKQDVDAINVAELLINSARSADFTILMPHRCNRCFLLSAMDILNLRELLSGAKFMIELNSFLSVCLKTRPCRTLA